jgi:hypothetical protein
LNPASVRAAISGETLSAPRWSSSLEGLDELGAPEGERAGRTAEADIPEFLKMAGGTTIERYGVPPQNPPLWLSDVPEQEVASLLALRSAE